MVTVIGGGVSGLTTAVALRRAGIDAHIVAAEPAEATVSWIAAAIWTLPDLTGEEPRRRWALRSREVLAQLAGDPDRGVVELYHVELFERDPGPTWWETTPWVHRLEDPPKNYAAGLGVEGFRMDPTIYLPWLRRWFEDLGGTVTTQRLESIDDIAGPIVNCSGLGAAQLSGDRSLYPIRGQVVAVDAPSVTEGVADESDPDRITYVYPRSREVILGGTRQAGVRDLAPDAAETERIRADAEKLDHRVRGAPVIEARVGLRPGRASVRLESESVAGRHVVHNYGHSGQGFVLSWGCAEQVVSLVRAAST